MGLMPAQQYRAIGAFLLLGVLCGVLYDCIRILRVLSGLACYSKTAHSLREKRLPFIGAVYRAPQTRTQWLRILRIALGDVLFSFACAVLFSICLFDAGFGIFRWFYLLAAAAGFGLYRLFPGQLVMRLSECIAFGVRVCALYFQWLFLLPLRFSWRCICHLGRWVFCIFILPLVRRFRTRQRAAYTMRVQKALSRDVQIRVPCDDERKCENA